MPVSRSARRLTPVLLVMTLIVSSAVAQAKQPPPPCETVLGKVFIPNPVATTGDNTLRDRKDSDQAVLNAERVTVKLTGLDGSGYLRGRWAVVVSETGDPAYETDCTYFYTRRDDRFEQVMAYWWVTKSQQYLRSLGFGTGAFPAVNADRQRVRINQWGIDNSFATTHPRDEMRFGKGGVDDAEDGDVILHELGHQIHFSQSDTFFSSAEAGAISEGFGDYWAFTVSKKVMAQFGLGPQFDEACIAKWDATSYDSNPANGICLRRIDQDLTYPDDLVGQVHADGRIWSRALYDLHHAIGQVRADTAVLAAQFGWTGTTMPHLAKRIVARAEALYGQGDEAEAVFEERGIL
ncbi:MAG TPA: bacillolysin [Candidatus Limnocylindria bacterium]|nr:bacillolysin [Candidatus Limnocylindria bacterium]